MARKRNSQEVRINDLEELIEAVYRKWDNPRKTRKAVQHTIMKDCNDPKRMALWNLAANSVSWDIEFPKSTPTKM